MQDRYAGDIGDFAKFALLRALIGDGPLRLGLVWYLTSQFGDPAGDGRHTRYLDRTAKNDRLYRSCDPFLHDSLSRLVNSGSRNVAAYPSMGILPPDTVYFDSPLGFDRGASRSERVDSRTRWVRLAVDHTAGCDIVMFDPDNGLEVSSTGKYVARGPKYVYFDELVDFVDRGQTIVIYQHANHSESLDDQISGRLSQMCARLTLTADPFALVWRSVSARAFLIAPSPDLEKLIFGRSQALLSGPLAQHLEMYP